MRSLSGFLPKDVEVKMDKTKFQLDAADPEVAKEQRRDPTFRVSSSESKVEELVKYDKLEASSEDEVKRLT